MTEKKVGDRERVGNREWVIEKQNYRVGDRSWVTDKGGKGQQRYRVGRMTERKKVG